MRSFVGYLVRAEARAGWRGWAATALVVGAVGGVAIGLLAGARRTETAHERFLVRSAAFDVLFANGGTTPENLSGVVEFEAVAALPEVLDSASVRYYFPDGTQPSGAPLGVNDLMPLSSPDGRFGTELNGARVLDGRLATATDEIALSVLAAEQLGLRVGDQLDVTMRPAVPTDADAEAPLPAGFTVVGIIAMQGGLPPTGAGFPGMALLAPRYAVEHPGGAEIIAVRLEGGPAEAAAFQRRVVRLAGGEQVVTATRVEMSEAVERGSEIQATALRALAAVVAAASVLLVVQALARQRAADRALHDRLVALGVTGGDLRLLAAARMAIVTGSAAVVAAIVAVAVSPLGPVGTARDLDPGGLKVNIAYVGGGALAVVAGMVVATVLSGLLRLHRGDAPASRRTPSRLAGAVSRLPLPVPVGLGARMAVPSGEDARAASNRTTFVTGVVGLVAVVTLLSFGTSLQQLFGEPRLYGWGWDVQIGDAFAPDLTSEADRLEGQSGVQAVAVATTGRIQIDGQEVVDALAIGIRQGSIAPVVIEGREPTDATDLLLGSRTLRDLGLEVGDHVDVGLGDRVLPMEVVGRGVLPGGGFAAGLGRGAALTLEGYRRLDPDAEADAVLLQFTGDDDGSARRAAVLSAPFGAVYEPEQPSDLADLEGLGGLPALIGGVIALAALGTLAHALHTDVVHRRHDLATFKALGFTRTQVAALVASHATALMIAVAAVGLPLGIGAGRWTWLRFADGLGVSPGPEVPVLALVLLVPLALILAALVALAPAARAARTPAGEALHVD